MDIRAGAVCHTRVAQASSFFIHPLSFPVSVGVQVGQGEELVAGLFDAGFRWQLAEQYSGGMTFS